MYKAVIVNLDVLRDATFDQNIHVMEDLEYHLRISGIMRDLAALPVESEAVRQGQIKKLHKDAALARPLGGAWMDNLEPSGPAVICKFYRFGFEQIMLASGGCNNDVAHPDDDDTPMLDDLAEWLRGRPELGKLPQPDMEKLLGQLDGVDLGDLLTQYKANGHGELMDMLKNQFDVKPAHALKIANAVQQHASTPTNA